MMYSLSRQYTVLIEIHDLEFSDGSRLVPNRNS